MNIFRGIFRFLHLIAHCIRGLYLSYTRLHGTQSHDLSDEQHKIIQTWLHRSAEIIGIDIQIHGTAAQSPAFIVANHISWLDIIIISSVLPVSFLSKAEIRSWPIIGTLAAKAGTLFIHRGSKNGAAEAVDLVKVKLAAGHSVASFPEAKTTDGSSVKLFHARLFAAAIETHTPVQPVALRYPPLKAKTATSINPIVPYVEGPNLVQHAFRIMCAKRTIAEVTLCNPFEVKEQARKELAQSARDAIAQIVESKKY
ncbi:MAG: lysophospholipid acyltransferase family protein [Gammaproteobacteria bacterium]